MAPPSPRRPGFSRRARYGMFAAYVAAVAGVIVALALVAIARFDPAGFQYIRGGALDVATPVTGAGRGVLRAAGSAGSAIGDYLDAASKNAALRRELAGTRMRLIRARADRLENVRLRGLLALREREPETIVATRIVGSTATSTRRLATIMAGRADGVHPGQPVRGAEGLVGRIFETGEHAARLLLVSDGGSTVPVRLARGGLPALAIGTGDGRIRLRPLIAGQNPFRRGDLAISSGTGGIFPPGIPVAVVTGTDSEGALARPLADPARLDFVTVQPVYAPEALLPPPGLAAAPK